jgi:3-hydroxyisobutyrate dehydrogenase-like beta-hydroxyacid dehydrogenase
MQGNIGFIGLGRMGLPMVGNLVKSGRTVIACEEVAAIRESSAKLPGLRLASSPAEVIEQADLVFTCLPSTDAIREVYLGADGICGGASSSKVVCELSTTPPDLSGEIGAALGKAGAGYLEATMIGPPASAESAEIFFIVAGDERIAGAVAPVLEVMGAHIGMSAPSVAPPGPNCCTTRLA